MDTGNLTPAAALTALTALAQAACAGEYDEMVKTLGAEYPDVIRALTADHLRAADGRQAADNIFRYSRTTPCLSAGCEPGPNFSSIVLAMLRVDAGHGHLNNG